MRTRRAYWVLLIGAYFGAAVSPLSAADPPPPTGDAVIRGKAGPSEIVITTTTRLAGAIHSLRWNGKEFIDSTDHGRQLQSAASFDNDRDHNGETFNPTEAGSRDDGAGDRSSSQLLRLHAEGSELETTTRMAFWLAPGEKSDGQLARNDKVLSDHQTAKRVRIGHKELAHAIDYQVTFTMPEGEKHVYAQFEALTGYMPAEFSRFWACNSDKGDLEELSDGPGEQGRPVVISTADGAYAMGVFSPDQPAPGFEGLGYGRFRFKDQKVNKWNCVFRIRDPKGIAAGDHTYQVFVAVGTLDDVKTTLAALVDEFKRR